MLKVLCPETHKERCFPPGSLLWFTLEVEVFLSGKMNQQEERNVPGSQSWRRREGASVQACCPTLHASGPALCMVLSPLVSHFVFENTQRDGQGQHPSSASLRDSGRELDVKTTFQSKNTDTPCPPTWGLQMPLCEVGRHPLPPQQSLEKKYWK